MNPRLKQRIFYSFVASVIASIGWYFYVLYTDKAGPDHLLETVKSGAGMFLVLTVYSYIKLLRRR